jgi:hypothetical protein
VFCGYLTFIITGGCGSITVGIKEPPVLFLTVWNKRSAGSYNKKFGIKEPAAPVIWGNQN